jgi:uncharacterized protein YukE
MAAIGGSGKGIQIVVGTNYNDKDLKRAQRDLDRLKSQAATTAGPMQKLGATMRGMVGPAFLAAGAAAGAFAVKLAVDGIQAAMDEEKQLVSLKQALDNVGQGFAMPQVNQFIDDLRFATGVADDELRPAFQRLVTATRDAAQAQELLSLALDISVGTGKSLESVSLALAKAATGQASSLRRLGVPLSEAAVKSGDLSEITKELTQAFGGQAAAAAETFAGQLARIKDGFDELIEAFGAGFISAFDQAEGRVNTLAQALRDAQPEMESAGKSLGSVAQAVLNVSDKLEPIIGYYSTAIQMNIAMFDLWGESIEAVLNPIAYFNKITSDTADEATGAGRAIENDMVDAAKKLYHQTDTTNAALQRQYFTIDEVVAGAGRYTDAMTLLRADMRRTIVRLGFLASAFDDANAAMDRRDSMRSYQAALKDFIADPSAETRDAAVSAAMDVANGFKDPQKQARFTASAVGEITKAAKTAGINVPPDLAKIGDAARNQLDPVASLKREMELIPEDIVTNIRVRTTYYGTPPPGGYPTTNGSAYGGFVGGHGGSRADDVPAMLSSGEFVIQAPAVSRFGRGFFAALNQGINPLDGMTPTVGGSGAGLSIGSITVQAAPGERAETSLPRALRRASFLAGVNG